MPPSAAVDDLGPASLHLAPVALERGRVAVALFKPSLPAGPAHPPGDAWTLIRIVSPVFVSHRLPAPRACHLAHDFSSLLFRAVYVRPTECEWDRYSSSSTFQCIQQKRTDPPGELAPGSPQRRPSLVPSVYHMSRRNWHGPLSRSEKGPAPSRAGLGVGEVIGSHAPYGRQHVLHIYEADRDGPVRQNTRARYSERRDAHKPHTTSSRWHSVHVYEHDGLPSYARMGRRRDSRRQTAGRSLTRERTRLRPVPRRKQYRSRARRPSNRIEDSRSPYGLPHDDVSAARPLGSVQAIADCILRGPPRNARPRPRA